MPLLPITYPLAEKPVKGRLIVRVAYADDNRWLLSKICGVRKGDLVWDKAANAWMAARKHHRILIAGLVKVYGFCHVIEHYSETEKCYQKCMEAKGTDCVCACQGSNHAGGLLYHGWVEIPIPHDAGPMFQRTSQTTRTFVVRA